MTSSCSASSRWRCTGSSSRAILVNPVSGGSCPSRCSRLAYSKYVAAWYCTGNVFMRTFHHPCFNQVTWLMSFCMRLCRMGRPYAKSRLSCPFRRHLGSRCHVGNRDKILPFRCGLGKASFTGNLSFSHTKKRMLHSRRISSGICQYLDVVAWGSRSSKSRNSLSRLSCTSFQILADCIIDGMHSFHPSALSHSSRTR